MTYTIPFYIYKGLKITDEELDSKAKEFKLQRASSIALCSAVISYDFNLSFILLRIFPFILAISIPSSDTTPNGFSFFATLILLNHCCLFI